jgi:hypothetical protein
MKHVTNREMKDNGATEIYARRERQFGNTGIDKEVGKCSRNVETPDEGCRLLHGRDRLCTNPTEMYTHLYISVQERDAKMTKETSLVGMKV